MIRLGVAATIALGVSFLTFAEADADPAGKKIADGWDPAKDEAAG